MNKAVPPRRRKYVRRDAVAKTPAPPMQFDFEKANRALKEILEENREWFKEMAKK
jgi:hypothetical protein